MHIVLAKVSPTWKGSKKNGERVCKRLDRFFMMESLVNNCSRYRSWVIHTNILDNFPIALEFEEEILDQNIPFKFNHSLLKNDDFCQMIRNLWISDNMNVMDFLVYKLKLLKK